MKRLLIALLYCMLCQLGFPAQSYAEENRADILEKVNKSVVHILVSKSGDRVASGTGFVCKNGYLLTCNHVIEDALAIKVHLPDGSVLSARKIGNVKETDLALLEVDGKLPPPLTLSPSKVRIGEEIMAVGYPSADVLGEDTPTVTRGMVSAVREGGTLLQIDAAVNPGNSGGPVLNERGEVIGVAFASLRGRAGMNFATGILAATPLLARSEPKAASVEPIEYPARVILPDQKEAVSLGTTDELKSDRHKTALTAAEYLTLCRKFGVISGAEKPTPDGLSVYEAKGNVAGLAERGEGFIILLRMEDNTTTNLIGSGPVPDLSVGTRVRVLVVAQADTTELGEANLLAIVREENLAAIQKQRSSTQPTPKTIGRPYSFTKRMGSREVLDNYKRAIRYFNRTGSDAEIDTIARAVLNYSIQYQMDARLVMAVLAVESNFDPHFRSADRRGLSGLNSETRKKLGVRSPTNPEQNVEAAVKYLRLLLDRFNTSDDWVRLQLSLAAYRYGPKAIAGRNTPPDYTEPYVRKVAAWYLHFLGEGQD